MTGTEPISGNKKKLFPVLMSIFIGGSNLVSEIFIIDINFFDPGYEFLNIPNDIHVEKMSPFFLIK